MRTWFVFSQHQTIYDKVSSRKETNFADNVPAGLEQDGHKYDSAMFRHEYA